MAAKGKIAINLNLTKELLDQIDDYRFGQRIASRTEAIEELLRAALERHTKKPGTRKKGE